MLSDNIQIVAETDVEVTVKARRAIGAKGSADTNLSQAATLGNTSDDKNFSRAATRRKSDDKNLPEHEHQHEENTDHLGSLAPCKRRLLSRPARACWRRSSPSSPASQASLAPTVMDIVSRRLAIAGTSDSFAKLLPEVDEAVEVPEPADQKSLEEQQQEAVKARATLKLFKETFGGRRRAMRPPAPVDNGNGKGKGKGKAAARPNFPRDEGSIPQTEAKRLTPPGAYIWRGIARRNSEWCGHLPPMKRIQEPWSRSSEYGAMKIIVRKLWVQYLTIQGKPASECAFEDLLTPEDVAEVDAQGAVQGNAAPAAGDVPAAGALPLELS